MHQDQANNITEAPYRQCVGCGYCCTKTPCTAARRIYGNGVTSCAALHWNGTRYICKLMALTGDMGEQYKRELYAGQGCCSPLNTWRTDVRLREREPKEDPIFTREFQAFQKKQTKRRTNNA